MRTVLSMVFLAALAGRLQAQDSTALAPYRAGSWGTEVRVGPNLTFPDLALLKFTSPTRAWYLDGQFNASKLVSSASPINSSGYSLAVTLGRRFYHPLAARASLFVTPNVTLGGGHQCTPSGCVAGWNAGVGVDVGAEVLVTSFAGLGVKAGAGLSYRHDIDTPSLAPSERLSTFSFNLSSPFGIYATLHL